MARIFEDRDATSGAPAMQLPARRTRLYANVDVTLSLVGFLVGAGSVAMLGGSLLEDHERRIVIPVTIAGALICGAVCGWALNFFVHFAGQTGP